MTNANVHLIADQTIGGVKREYIEAECKAVVGDYVVLANPTFQYEPQKVKVGDLFKITKFEYAVGPEEDQRVIANLEGTTFRMYESEYKTLEPTDIVQIDGRRYRLVKRDVEEGEKVLVTSARETFDKYGNGEVLTVEKIEYNGFYNSAVGTGDQGFNPNGFVSHSEYHVLVPVESLTGLFAEALEESKTIDDSQTPVRRIESLEQQLKDTQGNVERQAREIETLRKSVESKKEETSEVKINRFFISTGSDGDVNIELSFNGKLNKANMLAVFNTMLGGPLE